jgi:hypothetical protein
MYATPWHLPAPAGNGDLPGHLRLWRFERYYRLSADQLPAVLHQETLDAAALRFARWQHAATLTGARACCSRCRPGRSWPRSASR